MVVVIKEESRPSSLATVLSYLHLPLHFYLGRRKEEFPFDDRT